MKKPIYGVLCACLFLLVCSNPNGPETMPLVNAGNDTTVYILDTLTLHGTVTAGDSIIKSKWNIAGVSGERIADSDKDSITFIVPEVTTGTLYAIFEVENSKGEKATDTLTITVQTDSVVVARKIAFAPDSTKLWYTGFLYNAAGNVTKETRYEADIVTGWAVLSYSGSTLIKKEHYNADGSKAETEEYLPTRKNIYFAVGTLYGYDSLVFSSGSGTNPYPLYANPSPISATIFFTADNVEQYRCSYAYAGGKLSQKTYSASGTVLNGSYVTYEYDSKGRLSKEISHNPSGAVIGWNALEYATLHRMQQ